MRVLKVEWMFGRHYNNSLNKDRATDRQTDERTDIQKQTHS